MKRNKKETERLKLLECFPNKTKHREYEITHKALEFTSLCPKTGHPDFGTFEIFYIPDELCVELKSLKLYLQSYRNDGIFYENIVNKILDDLVEVLNPTYMEVVGEFNVRGGIASTVKAIHESALYDFDFDLDEDINNETKN